MSIRFNELLATLARGATQAQWEVKDEERRHFAALFDEITDDDGSKRYVPSSFALKLAETEALIPWLNMMHQDQFSLKTLEVECETSVKLGVDEEKHITVDCAMKKGLFQNGTEMRIKLTLESQPPTEGIEQIRDHFAHEIAESLKNSDR